MISTTVQRYILLVITTLCVLACAYIGYIIYNFFYVPIFEEMTTTSDRPIEPFPSATVATVLEKIHTKPQQAIDLGTIPNPFVVSTTRSEPSPTFE